MLATLPVSQHLAVIALFLAIFYGMLVGNFGAEEVGWGCAAVGVVAYALWRVGWEVAKKESVGREFYHPLTVY
jgi:phosphatidylinositol glycan class C protein